MSAERLGPDQLRSVVLGYRDALRAHQQRLNRLNVYPVPDGDTGTNMALTLEAVVAEVGSTGDMAELCRAISHGSLMGARGNSGVILSQVLRGMAEQLLKADHVDGTVAADALAAASAAAYQAVMRPVEGTILTVVREAAEAAQRAAAQPGASLVSVLEAAESAGAVALERTPALLPVLAEAGVVDAGGAGFLLLLDVLLQVVAGRSVPDATEALSHAGASPVEAARHGGARGEGEDVGDLRYEVMFLIEGGDDEAVDSFKHAWADVGDSIVVVGGSGLWNCHIHTNDIGAAIEAGIAVGRPRRIQVTDLAEQVVAERFHREAVPHTASAVVAVGAGDGAVSILRSLGAGAIVAGGQSMNPSTAELLAAIDSAPGAEVVVLPNNRNVIAVANHAAAAAATRGRTVEVVPTTSLAEGFAALMGFDADANAAVNAKAMAGAAERVSWGEVTWSVRDASTAAGPVREGDHLGLLGHEIVAGAPDLADAACQLLDRLVRSDHELVTVVEGEAATPEATRQVVAWLAEHRPDATVEVHRGDQPLSSYLFSAE